MPAAQPAGRRAAAAALDHALLLAIDGVVVHLTLRMASLTAADWHMLPPGPLLAFLALVKAAYFLVFTAVGGQTIGKMAMGIRVVTEGGDLPDAARALQRTLLGAVSVLTLGMTFLPAFVAPDGRALHDRVAGTRVIVVRR